MRRDIGNELLVAIGMISVLVFALAIAIIVYVANNQPANSSPTPIQVTIFDAPTQVTLSANPPTATSVSEVAAASQTALVGRAATLVAYAYETGTAEAAMRPSGDEMGTVIYQTRTAVAARTLTAMPTSTPTAEPPTRTPQPPTQTATNTPSATMTSTTTVGATRRVAPTSPPPSATATPRPASATPVSTDTATPAPSATDTARPTTAPSAAALSVPTDVPTATATATATSVPSATPTSTATQTATPVPTATQTATPAPTATSTATNTATQTATQTSTPTQSATPTATETHTPTSTPTPTETPTSTPTPTATETPVGIFVGGTFIPGILPTATYFPSQTPTPSMTSRPMPVITNGGCPVPPGWTAYTVQPGDTVFRLATNAGATVADVRGANCLADADLIFVGQTLYLPAQPSAQATPAPLLDVIGCLDTRSQISAPGIGAILSGTFEVRGTADVTNLSFYRIEVREAGENAYTTIYRGTTPVTDGLLATLDAGRFGSGLYYLRLVVVDVRGGIVQPCAIPVFFQS